MLAGIHIHIFFLYLAKHLVGMTKKNIGRKKMSSCHILEFLYTKKTSAAILSCKLLLSCADAHGLSLAYASLESSHFGKMVGRGPVGWNP